MIEKLSYEDFLQSFKLAPRIAIELLVENQNGALLLLKREKEPFIGQWHLPGGFLLKGELIHECIQRLAADELGIHINIDRIVLCELFENLDGDPRGHIIHYPIKIKSEEVTGKDYFSAIPKNTISYQSRFLKQLGYPVE